MAIDAIIADSIQQTIEECVDVIGNNYALDTLKKNGVVSMEEVSTVRAIATKILTEGQEDLIPENLEIPDMPAESADAPMGINQDTTDSMEDMDLDVSDLEGIILATADGSEYTVQDGILVPYVLGGSDSAAAMDVSEDEDDAIDAAGDQDAANPGTTIAADLADGGNSIGDVEDSAPVPTGEDVKPEGGAEAGDAAAAGEEESEDDKKDKKLEESENLGDASATIITENEAVSTAKVSSIVQSLISDLNFSVK